MEFCPFCRKQYKPGVEYCSYCGHLRVDCMFCTNPNCVNFNRRCADLYCPHCGEHSSYEYHKLRGSDVCGDLLSFAVKIAAAFLILYMMGVVH